MVCKDIRGQNTGLERPHLGASHTPVVQPPIAELVDTAIPYDQLGLLGNSKITSHIYSEAPETENVNKWRL